MKKQIKRGKEDSIFVSECEFNSCIDQNIVIAVSNFSKKQFFVKLGGKKGYIVEKNGFVNGNCTFNSLFAAYKIYLFNGYKTVQLTNICRHDEFNKAINDQNQILIAEKEGTKYIILKEKRANFFNLVRLSGEILCTYSRDYIFDNYNVFVVDI